MTRFFIKSASYFFHPIWMPLLGSILYFMITPKFFRIALVEAKLLQLSILIICSPLLFLYLLKNMRLVQSVQLKKTQERPLPLLFFCVLTSLALNYVLNDFHYVELYYFFVGILGSGLLSLVFSLFKIKISLHQIGVSGLCMFIISLSIYYQLNLIFLIAFMLFSIGWTASSRIQAKAHSSLELILGTLIGFLPQLVLFPYWIQ